MITNENLEHLIKTLEESGIVIPQDTLNQCFKDNSENFQFRINRVGKNEQEGSTLFFNKAENGIYTHTEIKEKNFTYLANQLLDAEMPASVIPELRDAMRKGLAEIKIEVPQTIKNRDTLSTLNLSYYPSNGFYYWNNYQFQILDLPEQNAGMPQRVYVDNDKWTNTYTPIEMTALLMGETITKELVSAEGRFYTQDKKLDFGEVDKHGNFKKVKASANTISEGPKQDGNKQSPASVPTVTGPKNSNEKPPKRKRGMKR